MKKRNILIFGAILVLVACGGGGGGSGGGVSLPDSGTPGDIGPVNISGCLRAGTSLTPDCEGANCGASGRNYTGSGVGIWTANNKGTTVQNVDVYIGGLSGQKVYLVFTNWGDTEQDLSRSILASMSSDNDAAQTAILAGSSQGPSDAASSEIETPGDQAVDGTLSLVSEDVVTSRTPLLARIGDSRTFKYGGTSVPTTLKAQASLGGGRTASVWVANNLPQVTTAHAEAVRDRFAGSRTRKSIYQLGRDWIGEPWGDHPHGGKALPGDTREINIVIMNLPTGILGLFDLENNLTTPNFPNSNKALVLYISGPELVATTGGTWTPTTTRAMNVYSTLAHEYQHMVQYYEKIIRRTDGMKLADTWLNELTSMLFQFYYMHSDQGGIQNISGSEHERLAAWTTTPSCQLNGWREGSPRGCTAAAYYGNYGAFASFLLRQYGPSLIKGIVQNNRLGMNALEAALNARGTCLAEVERRVGASLAIRQTTAYPAGYGFPAATKEGVSFPAIGLIGDLDPNILLHTNTRLTTVKPHASVAIMVASSQTSRYTRTVALPPKTSLTVIVSRK